VCLLSQLLSNVTVTSCRSSAGILHGYLQQDSAPSMASHTATRHVHRASHVAPKQPVLESSRLRCLGCPSTDGLSTSTIQDLDNQPAEWGKLLDVSSMAPLVSGVTSLSGSSRSKANKLNIWCKNCSTCVTLDNNWDDKHVVPLLISLKCVVTGVASFSIVAFKTLDISQGSVATNLRYGGIFNDSIITSFLLLLKV